MNYLSFVSEMRSEIYLYADDDTTVTVQCVRREQPYNADGVCGEPCDIVEVFVSFNRNPEEVEAYLSGFAGELNYEAVQNRFSASFTAAPFNTDGIDLTLTVDGVERSVRALSVRDNGVISCEQALKCAMEHDSELFASLTSGRNFLGEISIRLLYDDGCYYFVGVTDRNGGTTAYLLDGGTGKVIATKKG